MSDLLRAKVPGWQVLRNGLELIGALGEVAGIEIRARVQVAAVQMPCHDDRFSFWR